MGPTRRLTVAIGASTLALGGCATDVVRSAATTTSTATATTSTTTTSTTITTTTTTTTTSTTTATSTTTTTTASTTTASTTSTVAPTTPTTTTTVPTGPRRITIAFSGDILPHSPLWRQAERNALAAGTGGFDFAPMLAPLRVVHDTVDLAVCHLETPIAPEGEDLSTMPYYGVPAEIAVAIAAAGFDRCSTASNHAADRGVAGIERTVDALAAAGVEQSGMARRPDEIVPTVFAVGGIAVAHLSYTWSYNGITLPAGQEWRSALIEPDRILADARRARALGADLVIVSLHWGAEGVHAPTDYQRDVADVITAPGVIDLVVGHHAHVLQPIEQVNGTWVLFGLGSVLSNLPTSDRWPAASQDGAVVTVGVTVDTTAAPRGRAVVERPQVVATWVDHEAGWIVRVVDLELARPDLAAGQRGRLTASRARTAAVLGDFLAPVGGPALSGAALDL